VREPGVHLRGSQVFPKDRRVGHEISLTQKSLEESLRCPSLSRLPPGAASSP